MEALEGVGVTPVILIASPLRGSIYEWRKIASSPVDGWASFAWLMRWKMWRLGRRYPLLKA